MKYGTLFLLFFTSTQILAEPIHDTFLQHFIRNMHQQDASLTELYADTAKIERIISSDQGIEEIINLNGARYKEIIKDSKGKNILAGNSDFSDVNFFTNRSRIAIKATRHSHSQCFTDKNYYIVIDKQPNGKYKIIHERIEKSMHSLCLASNANSPSQNTAIIAKPRTAVPQSHASLNQAALAFAQNKPYRLSQEIQAMARNLKGKLPMAIDKNIQLTSLSHSQSEISYTYKIKPYQSNKEYNPILEGVIKPYTSRFFCTSYDTGRMLEHGGTIHNNYKDKKNQALFKFSLTKESCFTALQSAHK